MDKQIDIHKAGGILIQDKKFLISKSRNKDTFVAPGGKLEQGETAEQALIRELHEEFQITITESDFEKFGTFYAQAAGNESKFLRMDVFLVKNWQGEIIPDHEIEQILWIDSSFPTDIKLGSIFEHEVLPKLKQQNLIE